MEINYNVYNRTNNLTANLLVKDGMIIDCPVYLLNVCYGKSIDLFLEQMKIWGNQIYVTKSLVGISEIINSVKLLENILPKIFYSNAMLGYKKIVYNNKEELEEKIISFWNGKEFENYKYKTKEEKNKIMEEHKGQVFPLKKFDAMNPMGIKIKVKEEKKEGFKLQL